MSKADHIAAIQSGTRATAMAFGAFQKADRRLTNAVMKAREAGVQEDEINQIIAGAANNEKNPNIKKGIRAYAAWLERGNKPA